METLADQGASIIPFTLPIDDVLDLFDHHRLAGAALGYASITEDDRSKLDSGFREAAEKGLRLSAIELLAAMICDRDISALQRWLEDAATGPMSSFARGIRRDIDAVKAALTLPWSTGPVEGKINKLKLIKRSMYGRAGMDLLRSRMMAT
nr:transposase [Rhizobium ruizarguesonis]